MEDQSKVLNFPQNRRPRQVTKTGDAQLVSNVRSAWRKLEKVIAKARAAGLTVETDFNPWPGPTITKKL